MHYTSQKHCATIANKGINQKYNITMKIHHLNCGSMCPICQKLINGHGSYLKPAKLICHVLLIEHDNKLVLVDTGYGLKDIAQPKTRLGGLFLKLTRPKLDPQETAFEQIKALGFSPSDVSDIVPTHLDLDHIGGASDFPNARIHVYAKELDYVLKPNRKDRLRFRKAQLQDISTWQRHANINAQWYGFDAIDLTEQLGFEMKMIPLIGHTLGHVGVAVKTDESWLLHCGDAYFHHSQISAQPNVPTGLAWFERQVQTDQAERIATQEKLRALHQAHPEIELFCAHDPVELERYQSSAL